MLQRIYGTAFWNADELDAEMKRRAEAKERDHRKIGADQDQIGRASCRERV